jgi:hypothetical protein
MDAFMINQYSLASQVDVVPLQTISKGVSLLDSFAGF